MVWSVHTSYHTRNQRPMPRRMIHGCNPTCRRSCLSLSPGCGDSPVDRIIMERTEAKYRALLASAGFCLARVIPRTANVDAIECASVGKIRLSLLTWASYNRLGLSWFLVGLIRHPEVSCTAKPGLPYPTYRRAILVGGLAGTSFWLRKRPLASEP